LCLKHVEHWERIASAGAWFFKISFCPWKQWLAAAHPPALFVLDGLRGTRPVRGNGRGHSSDCEKAGLPAGCDTLPMFDVLEAQEKETGNEED